MRTKKPQIEYTDIESVYRNLFKELEIFARRQLIDKDNSIDAVNEGFINVLQWQQKNPGKPINPKIVYKKVARACRTINRHTRTGIMSLDDPALASYFRTV